MLSVCSQPGGIGNIIGTQGGFDVFDNRLDLSAVRDTRSRGKRRISYEHQYSSHRETYDARGTASSSEPRQTSCSSASLLGRVQVNITRLGDHEQRLSTIRIQDSQVIFSTTGIRLQVDLRSSVAFPETSNIEAQLKIGTVNTLAMVHPYPNTSSPHNLTLTAEYPLSEGIPTNPVPLQFCMQDRRTGSYQESPIGLFSVTPGFEGPIPSGLIKEDTNPTIDCAPSHNIHGTAALTRSFDELRPSTDRAHSYNTSFDYAPSFAQNPLGAQHSTQPSASSGDISTLSQSAPVQSHHVPRDHLRSAVEHQNPSSYWRADGSYCHIRTPRYGYQPQDLREDVDSDDGASEGPESSANPALIRTSTLPQFLGSSQMSQPLPVQEFNPFSLYPNQKAILEIDNIRLDRMSQGWNSEEYENRRRLVQFSRTQDGGKIIADFDSLPAEKWEPNMICVSCILWEEKEKHYITSVDTIALLEALVGARFTVEEKNRIRRNLEGFKPETISKAKAESEEFFKLIMQFPSPRPRNIEKDVKVFGWELLSKSLGKIISKYSASYSSTSGAINTPPSVSDYTAEPRSVSRPDSVMDIRSVSPATPQYHPMGYPSQLVATQIQSVAYPQPHQQQQQRIPQQKQQPSPLAGPPSTYYAVTAQYPMPGALYPTSLQPRYSHSLVGPPSLSPLGGPVQYDYRLMNRPQPGNALAPMPPGYQSAPGEYQE